MGTLKDERLDVAALPKLHVVSCPPAPAVRRKGEERNALVLRHMAFARSLARRYANRGEPLDDLEQVAAIGLLKAIERYDPARGDLRAFATPTILGEIRRHFRDRTWAVRPGRGIQDAYGRVQRATDALTAERGRSPSIAEIAREADLEEEEVLDALAARTAYRPVSLSTPAHDDEESETIAVPCHDAGYLRAEERAIVDGAIERLPARERVIVTLRFREDMTQSEIAAKLGISQMHVSRLLRKALESLRTHVRGETSK
jgi:RNA polymerase sigma-B factor